MPSIHVVAAITPPLIAGTAPTSALTGHGGGVGCGVMKAALILFGIGILLFLVMAWFLKTSEETSETKDIIDDEPTEDEAVRLLRQIEKNTSATHFWTRVTGIPVLLGMIAGFLVALEKCN